MNSSRCPIGNLKIRDNSVNNFVKFLKNSFLPSHAYWNIIRLSSIRAIFHFCSTDVAVENSISSIGRSFCIQLFHSGCTQASSVAFYAYDGYISLSRSYVIVFASIFVSGNTTCAYIDGEKSTRARLALTQGIKGPFL